jgi:hypothetical protein
MNPQLQKRDDGRTGWGRRFGTSVDSRQICRALIFTFIACWLILGASPKALPQEDEGAEYPVKLAFLYNFTKFVEWPPDAYRDSGAPLLICIVGQDPFDQNLEGELGTRNVGGHPVEVRKLRSSDKLNVCHVVFVPATEKGHADDIVKSLRESRTLTVGETEGFAERGGIINLTVEKNKVHFEVNQVAAESAGLEISARLLSIAKIVKNQDDGKRS